jgi:D-3-phosphoglycerate dehydrogenase
LNEFRLIYYKILCYQPENIKLLKENFELLCLKDPGDDTLDFIEKAHVILAPLGFRFGKDKIDQAHNLKVIGSNTTGHPHINVPYAKSKGIKVVTLKEYGDFLRTITPTAELTWGLIIALTRNMFPAIESVLNGKWDRRPFGGHAMLSRMSLGIAGYGRLGKTVANYGKCFGMKVRYYDPYVIENDSGIEKVGSLEELVRFSDIVTIHIPLEPDMVNLFDRKLLSLFKKSSFIINTSRGELIDNEALLDCLEKNNIAGAALDVLNGEFDSEFGKIVQKHPLVQYARSHSNLILTPHIGGSTRDAWKETEAFTIRKIIEKINS